MVKYYVFIVLVFGLAVAPFLFTKVTRPFINRWREQGIRIFGWEDSFKGVEDPLKKPNNSLKL